MYRKCIVFVFLSILLSLNLNAQTHYEEHHILGNVSIASWFEQTNWKLIEPKDYPCDSLLIEDLRLKSKSRKYEFYIFGGSWCSDTESELPKIVLVLRQICGSEEFIHLYGVDRNKREPSGTAEKFNIEKVPTLVVTTSGTEIGRIVEYPRPTLTWCDELNEILSERNK